MYLSADIRLIIFDLDNTLMQLDCNWNKINELRENGEKEKANELELKGVDNAKPIEQMINFVKNSKYEKAIFSMNSRKTVMAALKKFNILNRFCVIICKEDVKPKPDPEGILKIIKICNVSKFNTIYIGDRLIDIQAGENAGVETAYPLI